MQRKTTTSIIYLLASASGSLFAISKEEGGSWLECLVVWLCICTIPLMFIFAYAKSKPVDSGTRRRRAYESLFHLMALLAGTALFATFSPFWKNPLRDLGESLILFLLPLAVLVVFLVAGISLLVRNNPRWQCPPSCLSGLIGFCLHS